MSITKKPQLRGVSILLADADTCLAQAVTHILHEMGFSQVIHVRSSADALQAIKSQNVSFLITEWSLKGESGLELVHRIRYDEDSPDRSIPIIMLTGHGEIADVQSARDAGITEFVVKPFSAQTLYMRLEQIIDNPRPFVVAKAYVGPERRRRGLPPPGVSDRRIAKPVMQIPTSSALDRPPNDTPMLYAADFSLRQMMDHGKAFAELITPEILEDAQAAIDKLGETGVAWIREDIEHMRDAEASLSHGYSMRAFETIKEAALSIKSRAGTFGYRLASDVARLLYLFLSIDFIPTNPKHVVVIEKHVEALTVIFAKDIKEREGIGAELYHELERLIARNK